MSEDNVEQLLEATMSGTFDEVRVAFGACSIDEREECGREIIYYALKNSGSYALDIVKFMIEQSPPCLWGDGAEIYALHDAAENIGPCAFDIVKLLMEHGEKVNSVALRNAAMNHGPCALEMVKFMIERGANLHWKDVYGDTVFTIAFSCGNPVIADYLLSREDFLLSDIMPCPKDVSRDIYKTYRKKAISRVNEAIDANGLSYAKTIAADIEKILKAENPKAKRDDAKALEALAKKISSIDWVFDAKVSSDDFLEYNMPM